MSGSEDPEEGPYAPLAQQQFRLLKLKAAPPDQEYLSYSFEVHSLGDAVTPAYTALSYTWGKARQPDEFDDDDESVDEDAVDQTEDSNLIFVNGDPVTMTSNLHDALLQLSKPGFLDSDANEYFWIDALCIWQSNIPERNAMVAQMDLIFSHAANVIIWLGADLRFIEDFLWLHENDNMWSAALDALDARDEGADAGLAAQILREGGPPGEGPGWEAMQDRWVSYARFFAQQRYFRRAWVVQEVVLAKQIEMLCGEHWMAWEMVAYFPFLLRRAGFTFAMTATDMRSVETPEILAPKLLGEHLDRMCVLKDDCADGDWEHGAPDRLLEELAEMTLADKPRQLSFAFLRHLLAFVRQHEGTNPRDKVYAVLPLLLRWLPPGTESPISPDYNQTVDKVYTHVASLLATELPTLAVLSLVETVTSRRIPDLPSWVPDFSFTTPIPTLLEMICIRGIDFVSRSAKPHQAPAKVEDQALHVRGLCIDNVHQVGPVKQEDLLHSFYHPTELGWWKGVLKFMQTVQRRKSRYFNGDDMLNVLWKSLVAFVPGGKTEDQEEEVKHLAKSFRYWLIGQLTQPIDFLSEWVETASDNFDLIAELAVGTQKQFWLELQNMITRFGPAQLSAYLSEQQNRAVQVGPGRRIPGVTVGEDEEGWPELPDGEPEKLILNEGFDMPETAEAEQTCAELTREMAEYSVMTTVAVGRKLFATRERQLIGLGPEGLNDGDQVWWLESAALPFILRPVEGRKFRLVGEAYVCGLMGEELLNSALVKHDEAGTVILI